jgi:hypothetical protein
MDLSTPDHLAYVKNGSLTVECAITMSRDPYAALSSWFEQTPRRAPPEGDLSGRHVHRVRRVFHRAQDRAGREVPCLHG